MTARIKLLLIISICLSSFTQAQIGIQTDSPQALFHINGRGDADVSNDVVITSAGNVGIGTHAPTAKIDIISDTQGRGLRLLDGTGSQGDFLVNTDTGYGEWADLSSKVIVGTKGSTNITISKTPTYVYLDMYVSAPPGKSQVSLGGMAREADTVGYVTIGLSTSSTSVTRPNIVVHPTLGGFPANGGISVGQINFFVENNTTNFVTLYAWGTLGGGSSTAQWTLNGVAEPFIFITY